MIAGIQACSHDNTLVHHDAVPPTCTEPGVAEYWTCSACGQLFPEYHGLLPLMNPAKLPPAGHDDEDGDGVCDDCSLDMPTYTSVTQSSQIFSGGRYLLAAEIEEKLYLLAEPVLNNYENFWLVPGNDEVQPEEDGGYTVEVGAGAVNYAGTPLEAGSVPGSLSHVYPNRFVTDIGEVEKLVITVKDTAGEPMEGVAVRASSRNGLQTLLFESDEAVSDENGRAAFTVTGVSSGYDILDFTAGTIGVTMNTRVKPIGSESPKKPVANLTDGDVVAFGDTLVLSCDTEDAVIYYTTDDTCPCTESAGRRLYTGPVTILENTLFRVASYTETGGYIERINLRVAVGPDAPAVRRENDEIIVDDLPDGVSAYVAAYSPDGRLLAVTILEEGEREVIAEGADRVTVFFLGVDFMAAYPTLAF